MEMDDKRSPESPCSKNSNKEQDRFLPIANVGRIMKKVIPGNGKISKDAKETVQECVSEFISFVTGEASDHCRKEKRKTVNGDDVCWAMLNLGFDDYAEPLKKYLHKIRELDGERANQNKGASSSSNEEKDHIRQPHQETSSNYRSGGNQVPRKANVSSSSNLFNFNVI